MKTVNQVAVIDREKCNKCIICLRVCPVLAIKTMKEGKMTTVIIDDDTCQACTICETCCPQQAITMVPRKQSFEVGIKVDSVTKQIEEICRSAHMYPDQVVCYCHRVEAKEIVAAILAGANTPEEVSRKTGARTGCGVLCISGIIRLLRGAGLELSKAPGYQWYGIRASIWDIPPEVMKKYPQYYLEEDRKIIDKIFPGGDQK